MKKYYIFFIATFLISVSNAQHKFGVKAGGIVANFDGDRDFAGYDKNKYKPGYFFGVNTMIRFGEKSGLLTELLYSQKGTKGNETSVFGDKLILNYLNVPILYQLNIFKNFNIYAGPEVGILLSGKIINNDTKVDVTSNFQTIDFGLTIGGSYNITQKIYLDARFTEGLPKLQNGLYGNLGDKLENYGSNRAIQFGIGYKII